MNYPEARPLKRMPMAHIVNVTGKSHLENAIYHFSFRIILGLSAIYL